MLHVASTHSPSQRPISKLGDQFPICDASSDLKSSRGARQHVRSGVAGKSGLGASTEASRHLLTWAYAELIPGLPNDIAFQCLVRLPRSAFLSCRQVSRPWRSLLTSEALFAARAQLGVAEPWLYVRTASRACKQHWWQALDPKTAVWHPVPPDPNSKGRAAGAGTAVLAGRLYVVGGMSSDFEHPLDAASSFDPRSNCWQALAPLPTPRGYAATEALGGALVVAGGNGGRLSELRCAEAWQPARELGKGGPGGRGTWSPVGPLGSDMARYDSAVLDERLYVTEGWHWPFHFSPRGFVYDSKADMWSAMPEGMSEGWTGPACVLGGELCVVAHEEAALHRLEVYDPVAERWQGLNGPPLPQEVPPNFTVGAIGECIYVIGDGLVAAVGHVRQLSSKGGQVTWTLLPRAHHIQGDRVVDACCVLEA